MDADKDAQAKMATTAMLMDAGIALMRQNIRRRQPGKSDRQIDDELSAWLCRADDPVPGDVSGPVRVWGGTL